MGIISFNDKSHQNKLFANNTIYIVDDSMNNSITILNVYF